MLTGAHGACRSLAFDRGRAGRIFAGTDRGLLVSRDHGERWQEAAGPLANQAVLSLAVSPDEPRQLYIVADEGVFTWEIEQDRWRRTFPAPRPEAPAPDSEPEEPDADDPIETAPPRFSTIAVDPQPPHAVYVAGAGGVHVSRDRGATWTPVPQAGLPSMTVSHLIAYAHSPTALYASTTRGIARYLTMEDRWEPLATGLTTSAIRALAAAGAKLLAATDHGLFTFDLDPATTQNQNQWPSAGEILSDFVNEPNILQVQRTAIAYAEVQPEKISRWRRQASVKALLPTLKFGYGRDQDTYISSMGSTTNPQFDRIVQVSDPSSNWDMSVNWDLGNLLWSSDQTSIDTRSRLMVQLRGDVLDQVTRTYFERRRLQLDLMADASSDQRKHLDAQLRIAELTALLDAQTGGWFSRQLTDDDEVAIQ